MINLFRILVGGFLLVSVACVSATSGTSGGSWEQEVRAAEQRHRAAFLAGDVAALEAMFSADFVVNSPLNENALSRALRGGCGAAVLTALAVGVSLGLPLFLYLRERRLEEA